MPALHESFLEVLSALDGHYGRRERNIGQGTPFTALALAILAGGPEPRQVSAAEAALNDAGLLEPLALAEADVVEVREALKEGGIALKPKAVAPCRQCTAAGWSNATTARPSGCATRIPWPQRNSERNCGA